MDFITNAEPYLKAFYFTAIFSSSIFIIQLLMTLIGMADTDIDFDEPFQLFTIRNMINFLLGFSWTGIGFYNTISNKPILLLLAIIVGFLFIGLFILVIKQFMKLEEDNTFTLDKIVGYDGNVYLTIPAQHSGKGKIQISYGGTLHELEAVTDDESIPTGSSIKVKRVLNNDTVVVTPIF
jgi:hypothetical protein